MSILSKYLKKKHSILIKFVPIVWELNKKKQDYSENIRFSNIMSNFKASTIEQLRQKI